MIVRRRPASTRRVRVYACQKNSLICQIKLILSEHINRGKASCTAQIPDSGAAHTRRYAEFSYLYRRYQPGHRSLPVRGRKVRTAQGNAPVKSRGTLTRSQRVPQKITATWRKPGVRLKTWGKSPRRRQVTAGEGKPCMLKCHVYRRSRAARPMPEGRQLDPCSNAGAR